MKKTYTRECEHCEVNFKVNKKSLKKELAFKKNQIVIVDGLSISSFKHYGFLKLKSRIVNEFNRCKYKCKVNLYNEFFICPICKRKSFVVLNLEPNEGFYSYDKWKLIDENTIRKSEK